MCNQGIFGGNCCWIIIAIILLFCCCGNNNRWDGNCGCNNNSGCC